MHFCASKMYHTTKTAKKRTSVTKADRRHVSKIEISELCVPEMVKLLKEADEEMFSETTVGLGCLI